MTTKVEPLSALDALNAHVTYRDNVALYNITFEVPPGSFVGVIGPNGAGKSTLLKTLVGIIRPTSGQVRIFGDDPAQNRGMVGYVPQSESVNWHLPVTAWDVVMMGRIPRIGAFRRASEEDRDAVRDALERVGMLQRSDDLIEVLSGGQRQRVFVARALAQNARVIMLDEAFSGVDIGSQYELVAVLKRLCEEGHTVVLSTHDLVNMIRNMDIVLCLNCHLCAWGPPDEAFTPEVMAELYGTHTVSTDDL